MIYCLIATMLPSVFGVKILDYLNKNLSLKNIIFYYLILVLCSNIFNCFFAYLLFGVNSNLLSNISEYPILFCKFSMLSIVINVILSLIILIIQKNVKIEVVVDKNENKKHKK